MNKKPDGNESLFPGLKVPEPPEDLRSQVLSRARQVHGTGQRLDLWAKLWESRQARLAWAASILALTIGHLVLPWGDAEPARERSTQVRATLDEHEDLTVISDLPKLSFDGLPRVVSTRAHLEPDDDLDTDAPLTVSEENAS